MLRTYGRTYLRTKRIMETASLFKKRTKQKRCQGGKRLIFDGPLNPERNYILGTNDFTRLVIMVHILDGNLEHLSQV